MLASQCQCRIEGPSQFRAPSLTYTLSFDRGHFRCPSCSLLFRNTCATCFSNIWGSRLRERLFLARTFSHFALLQRVSVPSSLSCKVFPSASYRVVPFYRPSIFCAILYTYIPKRLIPSRLCLPLADFVTRNAS
jgi:hypothetical protein